MNFEICDMTITAMKQKPEKSFNKRWNIKLEMEAKDASMLRFVKSFEQKAQPNHNIINEEKTN